MKKGNIPIRCGDCGGHIRVVRKGKIDFNNYRIIGSRNSQKIVVEYKCCRCGKIQ